MQRTIAMFLTALFVCGFVLCTVPSIAFVEPLYVRKNVSVAYDNSGSMSGNKWDFANYAMQSFCGMMNSEDKLFITYIFNKGKKTDHYNKCDWS